MFSTYKFFCVKNPYAHFNYECVKCNNAEEFLKELEYWEKKKCETKIIEISQNIPESCYENILRYNLHIDITKHVVIHDWTKKMTYKEYPRRPT